MRDMRANPNDGSGLGDLVLFLLDNARIMVAIPSELIPTRSLNLSTSSRSLEKESLW